MENRQDKSPAGNQVGMKPGAFSMLLSLMLLASLILINLTVGRFPSRYTQLDISKTGLYELSGQSMEVIVRMNRETYIYWIVQSGKENHEFEVLLQRYRDMNPLFHVE